jgi:hypothetical protein
VQPAEALYVLVKVGNLLSVRAALCHDLDRIAPKRRSYRKVVILAK